jgi:hypothetical protein
MIYLKYIIFSLLIFSSCTVGKSSNRGSYLIRYLEDVIHFEGESSNLNVIILYTDRCKTCSSEKMIFIDKIVTANDFLVILNFSDSTVENQINSKAVLKIDNGNLEKYGLSSPENQIFIIKDNEVIFDAYIEESNYKIIEKELKKATNKK